MSVELQTEEVLGIFGHGFEGIQEGDCVRFSPNFPAPFGCLLGWETMGETQKFSDLEGE